MRYRAMAPYSILGTGLWATTFTLLGYYAFATSVGGIAGAFAITEIAWAGICYWALTRTAATAARPMMRGPMQATDLPR